MGQGWVPGCLETAEGDWRSVLWGEGTEGELVDSRSRLGQVDGIVRRGAASGGAIAEWDVEVERRNSEVERRNFALKQELRRWVLVEQEVMRVEAAVRKRRVRAGGRMIWFESEWEGWWIEEAVGTWEKDVE